MTLRVNVYHKSMQADKIAPITAFADGLRRHGIVPTVCRYNEYAPSDVAVVWGQMVRNVIGGQRQKDLPYLEMEMGLHDGVRGSHHSIAWNGHRRHGNFVNVGMPNDRWIKQGFELLPYSTPWNRGGKYVLIAGSNSAGKSTEYKQFIEQACVHAKRFGMPVVYRPYPRSVVPADFVVPNRDKDITVSKVSLDDDLRRCALLIHFDSDIGTTAAIRGIPVISGSDMAMAWDVSSTDWTVQKPDRDQWAWNLGYCHWTLDEIRHGDAWDHLKSYLAAGAQPEGVVTAPPSIEHATYAIPAPQESPATSEIKISSSPRVAIVGNALSLMDTDYGSLIDSYDIVCRINNFAIPNTESHGNRTDVFYVNAETMHLYSEYPADVKVFSTVANDRGLDVVDAAVVDHWVKRIKQENTKSTRLTTGFLAIQHQLSLGRDVTLFGFDWYETKTFYTLKSFDSHHNPGWEKSVIMDDDRIKVRTVERKEHAMTRYETLDVFDTIIARKCIRPDAVFDIVNERFPEVEDFKKIRKSAEHMLRGTNYTLRNIYDNVRSLTSLPPETVEMMMTAELQVEAENVIPIADNLARLNNDSILISDMYLSADQIRTLINRTGYNCTNHILQSCSGKRTGRVWSDLKDRGILCNHIGDNETTDIGQAKAYGHHANLTKLSDPTSTEGILLSYFPNIARCMRACRLATQSTLPPWLYDIQNNVNTYAMLVLSLYLASVREKDILFSSRDCYSLKLFFDRIQAIAGSDKGSAYINVSRATHRDGSTAADDYFRSVWTPDSLLVDYSATGASPTILAKRLDVKIKLLTLDSVDDKPDNDNLETTRIWSRHKDITLRNRRGPVFEMMNFIPEGRTYDYTTVNGSSFPLKYQIEFNSELLRHIHGQRDFLAGYANNIQKCFDRDAIAEGLGNVDALIKLMPTICSAVNGDMVRTFCDTFYSTLRRTDEIERYSFKRDAVDKPQPASGRTGRLGMFKG